MSAETTAAPSSTGGPQPSDRDSAGAGQALPPGDPRRAARAARRARYRSAGGARWGFTVLGLVLAAAGVLALLLQAGLFGAGRALRPVLDPLIEQFLVAVPTPARVVAIVAGLVLVVLGLLWAVRALRPESRPELVLDAGDETEIRVSSAAAADAVADGATALPGVTRSRARMVGSTARPAVRASVWVDADVAHSEVAEICRRLDAEVLPQVRDALELADLPVAVRIELDSPDHRSGPRVA
ncbi:hypothetical protein [Pseudonocardia sp. HH130630-07]|uniref:hypothetical protein n=1 Tax=Pseudonocardia sp. HH130630-07 TaxID=1690815 RepID=UPI000815013D|nr:hypothetical protein [Pseudonocardia sp. HH130630-07]ANY05002.1 hypothetical protein AFB00_00150 [Pseudonocardia sp. HH130630-07]